MEVKDELKRRGGGYLTTRLKTISLLVVIAAIAAGIVTGRLWLNQRQVPASDYTKVTVSRRAMHREVVSSGTVKPQVGAEVKVGSRISGTVRRLFVEVGDRVKKDDVVAIIEHEDLSATLRQAEALLKKRRAELFAIEKTQPKEINRAHADIKELEVQLDLAQLNLGRQRSLRKGEYVSQEALDQAEKEVKVLEAQLLSAHENLAFLEARYETDLRVATSDVAEAEAAVENSKINLSYATIRAPITGLVGSISTQEGETVAAALNAPTFITLVDLERVQVHDYVDETDIGMVLVGQEARFTVDAYPGHVFRGKVEAIYPMATVQENVVYYEVIITILKSGEVVLRPEMTATVYIIVDSHPQALALPNEAIVRMGQKRCVAVEDSSGNIQKRQVAAGWVNQGYTEILSGLEEGETVLIGALKEKKQAGGRK